MSAKPRPWAPDAFSDRQAEACMLLYGHGYRYSDAARLMGVTRERVRQLDRVISRKLDRLSRTDWARRCRTARG